jgi:hypothetical protein
MNILPNSSDFVLFSSYHGLSMSGTGSLSRLSHTILDFRKLPDFEARRIGTNAYFVRNIKVDRAPARLIGFFQIAPDSSARAGLFGYAVCCQSRTESAFLDAANSLAEIQRLTINDEIATLINGELRLARPTNTSRTNAVVERYYGETNPVIYGYDNTSNCHDLINSLWRLSWIDDNHESFIAFDDPTIESRIDERAAAQIEYNFHRRFPNIAAAFQGQSTRPEYRQSHTEDPSDSKTGDPMPKKRIESSSFPEEFKDDIWLLLERHEDMLTGLSAKFHDLEREISDIRSKQYSLSQKNTSSAIAKPMRPRHDYNTGDSDTPRALILGAWLLGGSILTFTAIIIILIWLGIV